MFIGKQRTEKKTRDFQTVIKVRALFWFDHFGIFDWIYQFSAGKIQFFRCVSVAYFILMVFRYSFDFGFYIFSVHQFAQLLFSISIWREKFLRFIHLFVDIQLGFLYGILSSLSLDNVQLFENVKYGKEATANFVMWRIRNFNIIIFFFGFLFVSYFIFILFGWNGEKRKIKIKIKKTCFKFGSQERVCMRCFFSVRSLLLNLIINVLTSFSVISRSLVT